MGIEEALDVINSLILQFVRVDQPTAVEGLTIAKEALEKQIPKKIVISDGNDCCPICNHVFGADFIRKKLHHWDVPFCQKCGQKLDWEGK